MKTKAFTLIELLVVIAIIALLLSIIAPALRKAKDAGQRIVCSNNVRSLGTANQIYASEHNGWYVPVWDPSRSAGMTHWVGNPDFRSYMQMDQLQDNPAAGSYDSPDKLLCPSDRISRDPANAGEGNVLISYGYNLTDWGFDSGSYKGHRSSNLKLPASKLAFTESVDWWVDWSGANYQNGWDKLDQASLTDYKNADPRVDGPVLYRHAEGANVGFYDGHVDYMKKTDIFDIDAWRATPRKPGMWVVDLNLYQKAGK